MTVTTTESIVREKAEPETSLSSSPTSSSFATSPSLLDTEIDCEIWALGITEKTDSAEVMLEKESGFKQLEGISRVPSKDSIEAKDSPRGQQCHPQPQKQRHQHQLFDFVHIRYQNSGISDGRRVFRLAFEQTKPGGWIEVLEASSSNSNRSPELISPSSHYQRTALPHLAQSLRKRDRSPANTSYWVKQQLLEAGFVDVEEKVARVAGSPPPLSNSLGPLGRLWGLGRYVGRLCSGMIGLQWRCQDGNPSMNTGEVDEKTRLLLGSPSVFVIARKPVITEK